MRRPPEKSSLLTFTSTISTSSMTMRWRLLSKTSENTDTSRGVVPSSRSTKAILPRAVILARTSITTPARVMSSLLGSSWDRGRRTKRRTSSRKALKGWPDKKKPMASFSSRSLSRSPHGRTLT